MLSILLLLALLEKNSFNFLFEWHTVAEKIKWGNAGRAIRTVPGILQVLHKC